MRRFVLWAFGCAVAVFISGQANAAPITISAVTDDFSVPFSYTNSGNHDDTVALTVTGGTYLVQFTLTPVSGAFRDLTLGLDGIKAPVSALPTGYSFAETLSPLSLYSVLVHAKRNGGGAAIQYSLDVKALSVDPGLVPIPAGIILFVSGLGFLLMVGRKTRIRV